MDVLPSSAPAGFTAIKTPSAKTPSAKIASAKMAWDKPGGGTPPLPPSAAAFRRRAEQCLRFADQLDLSADPSVPALRDMALEYEAAARALEAQPSRFPTAR